jgi:MobA/MobL family/RepB DNA-primase from phage plasmid
VVQAAYYRFENKIVTRGKGHSAVAAAAYNAAEKLYDDRTGTRYDFSRKQHVYHTEILAPANAPPWVFDRSKLWNHAEQQEKRVDSQVARHFILSLPNFLPHENKIQVTRQFLQRECVAKGMIADVCFHDFDGDKKDNPHAHVLLTMREMHPSGFATKKNRQWNKKEQHQEWREKWAAHLNQHFEQHGYDAQVDHRSYEAQGIDRIAGIHEGRAATAIRQEIAAGKRKETTSAIDFNAKVAELNRLKEEIRREEEAIRKEEERLLEKLTAEQDNRKPTPEDFHATTRRVMELQAQPVVNYEEVTQEVLKTATRTQQESAPVAAVPTPTDVAKHLRKDIPKKPSKGDRPPPDNPDRTTRAVQRQLEAMGGNGWFEIGIRNEEGGYFTERTWHKDQLLQLDPETNKAPILSYLKQENAKGSHIYVRPAPHANGDSQGLILIDDLDPVMAEELRSKGLEPSVIVETSRKNCQAWVRISDRVTREEATHLAKLLAQETGGDPASASYQHYGRLAGFTNRKDKHLDVYTGKYPWVLVHHAKSQLASRAGYFLEQARHILAQERAAQQQALAKRADLLRETASNDELRQALKSFKTISTSVERRHNLHDPSRRDWVVLKKMAKRGYSVAAMEYALRHSDDLEARKKGHEEDYIRRTIDKISRDPDVLMTLERRKERQERQPPHHSGSQGSASGQAPQDVASQAPKPEESPKVQDKRGEAEQRHYYKDRDRSRPAASAPDTPGAMKQPPGKTPSSSSGSFGPKHRRTSNKDQTTPSGSAASRFTRRTSGGGSPTIRLRNYDPASIPVYPLGNMDSDVVQYVITQTLHSEVAQRQVNKALWALTQDTSTWKNPCGAEYLKELGRIVRARGAAALTPHTDAELAIKLRMAGFSKKQIGKTLEYNSPFVQSLPDAQSRHIYLAGGIAPVLNHWKTHRKIQEFHETRTAQAYHLPEAHRREFLREHRFEKLNIATVPHHSPDKAPPSSQQPKQQHPEQERER